MRLKATYLLLLFLLVGLQTSAAVCAAHCTMESMDSPSQASDAPHRGDVAFSSGPSRDRFVTSMSSQPCDSNLCDADWMFLQNQDVQEPSLVSLPIDFAGNAVAPIPIASRWQFEANRSTRSIQPFDPLISNLRV